MGDAKLESLEAFQKDSRIACQYGAKCYQKNPMHHQKYKHPPANVQKPTNEKASKGKKRKIISKKPQSVQTKKKRKDETSKFSEKERISPTPSLSSEDEEEIQKNSSEDEDDDESEKTKLSENEENPSKNPYESPVKTNSESSMSPGETKGSEESSKNKFPHKNESKIVESRETPKYRDSVANEKKEIIKKVFLFEMPVDFYQFYEFCCSLSPKAPESAMKPVGLEIVGPFEVLCDKIKGIASGDEEKFIKHWRYFYDPPEFQTILKSNTKDGLHFGYWRDEDNKLPVFVAKNVPKKDCKILPVGENLFAAVLAHAEERLKASSPFEKASVSRFIQKIKSFAKNFNINLEQETLSMRSRNRKTVTKTFNLAGIVVPYDKGTQIGYRTLAATDSQLKLMLKKLGDENEDANVKKEQMSNIEEIVRLATIAADESDFGTPLELAHNLFSSGAARVQQIALQMFKMSYNLLQRPVFSKIAEVHLNDRKNELNLSVL